MKRIGYAIATVILLLIEVLIALYVHDAFVRPYIGDVLVVIVIYTFIRIFVPERCKLLPLYVFIFAALVEFSQMFHIVEVLGWQDNRFLSVLVGSVFDWKDIQCYAAGGILLGVYEVLVRNTAIIRVKIICTYLCNFNTIYFRWDFHLNRICRNFYSVNPKCLFII